MTPDQVARARELLAGFEVVDWHTVELDEVHELFDAALAEIERGRSFMEAQAREIARLQRAGHQHGAHASDLGRFGWCSDCQSSQCTHAKECELADAKDQIDRLRRDLAAALADRRSEALSIDSRFRPVKP